MYVKRLLNVVLGVRNPRALQPHHAPELHQEFYQFNYILWMKDISSSGRERHGMSLNSIPDNLTTVGDVLESPKLTTDLEGRGDGQSPGLSPTEKAFCLVYPLAIRSIFICVLFWPWIILEGVPLSEGVWTAQPARSTSTWAGTSTPVTTRASWPNRLSLGMQDSFAVCQLKENQAP